MPKTKETLIDKLNDDQVIALSNYIKQEGERKWRDSLNDAWMYDRYTGEARKYSHLLQQIRNKDFGKFGGPTFITKITAQEVHAAAKEAQKAHETAIDVQAASNILEG